MAAIPVGVLVTVTCAEQVILCPYLPLYKAAFQNINKGCND
jgi:hypothetical protein